MIGYLCSQGANIQSQNSLGLSCLHMAFSTGNVETIRAVQQALKGHQGWRTEDDGGLSLRGETALEFGIRGGKCSVQTLAELAPITGSSLRSFIHHAPECIPLFLSYAFASHQDGQRVEQLLAQELTSKDMAQLLRLNPEVAVVLLHLFTAAPETMGEELAGDEGWHPLPKRVSFGSRVVSLLGLFGLQASWFHRIRCFYEADTVWRFDAETHTAPDWHRKVTDLRTPPMLEACIRVCYAPWQPSGILFYFCWFTVPSSSKQPLKGYPYFDMVTGLPRYRTLSRLTSSEPSPFTLGSTLKTPLLKASSAQSPYALQCPTLSGRELSG